MIEPIFSVVIPVLNGAETIEEELDALAGQQGVDFPWEVIVADNGSTDATRDIVRARVEGFPAALRLVDASAVRGAAFACNAGAVAAVGSSLAFCAADDRVGPRWVAAAHEALQGAEAVGGPIRQLRTPHDPNAPILRYSIEHAIRGDCPVIVGTGNLAMRRDEFLRVGGLDFSMTRYGGEDNEFALRVMQAGVRPAIREDVTLFFRSAPTLRTEIRKILGSAGAEVDIWRKHPDQFPFENGRGWLLAVLREYPGLMLHDLRNRNPRSAVRFTLRRLGNIRSKLTGRRRPLPPPRLIDQVEMPRDITKAP